MKNVSAHPGLAYGAVIDGTCQLEAIDSTLAAIAYRHHWSDIYRSNFIYSMMDIDNDTALIGTAVTESASSWQANIMMSPVKGLTFGLGYLSASRKLESGAEGDLDRLIFSAKYGF